MAGIYRHLLPGDTELLYSPGYRLSYLAPVRGDQRYRLAELLLRAADKLIIRDRKFEFEADMLCDFHGGGTS
jgi:hypothetical protein